MHMTGMTNRKDMIDEALLRPGRFEVQMEIGLPDEPGRLQILKIHTAKLSRNRKLASDVNLPELATLTKNFSGAEIEGLSRAATTLAMNRHIKAYTKTRSHKLINTRPAYLSAIGIVQCTVRVHSPYTGSAYTRNLRTFSYTAVQ